MKSVTELLQEYGYITPYIRKNPEKTQAGTDVHEKIVQYLEQPYAIENEGLQAIKFLTDFQVRVKYYEKRLEYTYSGKPDIVGLINNYWVIIDWKTGGKQKHWGMQLWGYSILCQFVWKIEPVKLYTVRLKKDRYFVDNWQDDLEGKSKWLEIMTKEGLWQIKK